MLNMNNYWWWMNEKPTKLNINSDTVGDQL